MSFEEWIRSQIGSDAKVNWAVRTGEAGDLPWVEADISVGNQPGVVIMIACGRKANGTHAQPRFKSLELLRQNELAQWSHLRDLPLAMRKARTES